MAQRIQTVCDIHLDRGEDVDGETWEVLVRKTGTRTLTREIDLCGECAQTLGAVAALVAEHGRTAGQSPPAKSRAAVSTAPSGTVTRAPADATGRAACPVLGCDSVVLSSNLARHVNTVHGLTLTQAHGGPAPDAQAYPCPDCDRTFARAQALGAHRYQAHGYESPSRAERLERAAS